MNNRMKRANMVRQMASHEYDEEYAAILDKIHIYEEHLHALSDAEFNQAVIKYAEKLIEEAKRG
jgi:hypothetical protein